jgi:putative addiction module component (TIGR02574 family)
MELGRDTERRIQEKIASGHYRSPEEVVDRALDALEYEQNALAQEQRAIRQELDRRYDDLKDGHVEPVLGEEAFTRIRARLDTQGG